MRILDYLFGDTYRTPGYNPNVPTMSANVTGMQNTQQNQDSGTFLPNLFMTPNLAEAGLLGPDTTQAKALQDALQSQATKAGLLSAGVSFLTQPRTLGAGSALPYLGRAYQQGMQSAGDIYGTGLRQYATQQAFGQKEGGYTQVDDGSNILLLDKQTGDVIRRIPKFTEEKQVPLDRRYIELGARRTTGDLLPEEEAEFNQLDAYFKGKTPQTSVTVDTGKPQDPLYDINVKEIYTPMLTDVSRARNVANRTKTIDTILGDMEGGKTVQLSADAQAFLGLDTEKARVSQVVNALANVGATTIRTPGSGSTSDMEFGAYKSAFPSLATTKAGRKLMVRLTQANANRNAKLADWTAKALKDGTFDLVKLGEYDNSLGQAIDDELKKDLDEYLASKQGVSTEEEDYSDVDAIIGFGG